MRNLDFSSWQNLLSTLVALSLVTLIGVGIRLVAMGTIQQRRERANRQINERLRVLIAAYKILGGSFTGDLAVDPTHLRDLRLRARGGTGSPEGEGGEMDYSGSDRARRMRDAVEAALSDVILLGTESQVRLAGRAVSELVAGRKVHTHELVISLRDFIRKSLDLDPVPTDLVIPKQGPTRPGGAGDRSKARGGAEGERSGRSGGSRGGGEMAMGAGMGGVAGFGMGEGGLSDHGKQGDDSYDRGH